MHLLEINLLPLNLTLELESLQWFRSFHDHDQEISQKQVVNIKQDELNLLWGQEGNPTDRDDQHDKLG